MRQSTLSLALQSFQPVPRVLRCSIWLGTSMPCSSMLVVQSRCGSCFFSMPWISSSMARLSSALDFC